MSSSFETTANWEIELDTNRMALKGVKVIEFVGLAPGPLCGKILTDFGACVTRIDRTPTNHIDVLQEGKRTIAVNLKHPKGAELAKKLCINSDVLIEPFRPGVMEKLGLGPESLLKMNPRLIYARLTGFGQTGSLAHKAGHDLNYVALSGMLSMLGRKHEKPTPPINFAADFAGGSLMCAFGILVALFERTQSGQGQVIDAAMVEGTAYIGSWLLKMGEHSIKVCDPIKRGENLLDTGAHFYDTYETKDGKFMSVGALEPQFYKALLNVIPIGDASEQYSENKEKTLKLTEIFRTKTQAEWVKAFENVDACVIPVLTPQEALKHPHNKARGSFVEVEGSILPKPAPILSRTPGELPKRGSRCEIEEVTEILGEIGVLSNELKTLYEDKAILLDNTSKL